MKRSKAGMFQMWFSEQTILCDLYDRPTWTGSTARLTLAWCASFMKYDRYLEAWRRWDFDSYLEELCDEGESGD